ETITTLRFKSGRHDVAAAAGRTILDSAAFERVSVEPPVFDAAWSLFIERTDKPWSFTDCTSFVLMENLGIRQAVAFDANFRQAGFATFPLTRSWRLGRRPLRSPPRSAGRLAIEYVAGQADRGESE